MSDGLVVVKGESVREGSVVVKEDGDPFAKSRHFV
jgi:hypothetical protein